MSSWIIAKNKQAKKKVTVITKYHDTSLSGDVFDMYLDYIGAYIYAQKLGETCNVWDSNGIIKESLKLTPQVKLLKEKPEAEPLTVEEYSTLTKKLTFKEIQKIAASLIVYDDALNRSVIKTLEKVGIKTIFDIGIQLVTGADESLLKRFYALVKAFQVKSKKEKLNIYVMADSYDGVVEFQKLCDPSWKITSLSKNVPRDSSENFIQVLAEVQIMTALPALILDFNRPVDKYIYLMQRNPKLDYFLELNSMEWNLF
uniref:Uncharacterized protein n=1 Tax=viral metagenome TaxID=1070528 RepID=A0A6C0AP07_9ZZZZ